MLMERVGEYVVSQSRPCIVWVYLPTVAVGIVAVRMRACMCVNVPGKVVVVSDGV